jgi:hypothetical protein
MAVLLVVLALPLIVALLYRALRNDATAPALLQEWAKANHLVVLRKLRSFVPWNLRAGLRYSKQDQFTHLEVLDETTRRVRRVWLLVRSHLWHDSTPDDIEVIGWDADG